MWKNRISQYYQNEEVSPPVLHLTQEKGSRRLPNLCSQAFVVVPAVFFNNHTTGQCAFCQHMYQQAYKAARQQVREKLIQSLRPAGMNPQFG